MFNRLISLCCGWLVLFIMAAFPQSETGQDSLNSRKAMDAPAVRQAANDTVQRQQKSNGPEVGKITPEEEKQVERRIVAKNYQALGLGPAGLWGLSSGNLDYLFQYGYYWEVAPWAAIKFKSDNVFDFSATAFMLAATIGSNFYLTPTNISPFIGVDFGVGLAKKPKFNADFGFVVGGSVGVAFFRTATAQLLLDLNAQTILNKVDNSNPGKYSLGISVLF